MFPTVTTFPCPNCHEFINSAMTTCKYCSVPIDPQIASMMAERQEKVNDACNSASLIRNLAGAMWLCFAISRFVPFIGFVAAIVALGLFFVVPIRLIYWQARYGGIQTTDVDYKQAKRNILLSLVLWSPMLLLIGFLLFALALAGK